MIIVSYITASTCRGRFNALTCKKKKSQCIHSDFDETHLLIITRRRPDYGYEQCVPMTKIYAHSYLYLEKVFQDITNLFIHSKLRSAIWRYSQIKRNILFGKWQNMQVPVRNNLPTSIAQHRFYT